MNDPRPKSDTTCARPAPIPPSVSEPLSPPIQLSSVYRLAGLEQVDALYEKTAPGFFYARDGHPNAVQLAEKVAALEGAEAACVCASGMAAEAAIALTLLDAGARVALSEGLYGRTGTLLVKELGRFGVEHDLFDASRPETLRAALKPGTRLVFVETLSNPLVRLADIPALAEIARGGDARLVVDHSFAPLLCRPIEMGADLVVHSATKLIGGHSDLTLGVLAGPRGLVEQIAPVASTFGMTGNPFESWLALRGIATLGLRVARTSATARTLAERLEGHSRVRMVHYPGLASHPDHKRASELFSGGFGAMMAMDLGDRTAADAFIRALRHIPFAPSLGDVATTLSHPATTSHRFQTPEQWARQGITPGLVRLSIGLEDADDLWDDLRGALDGE